jgi:hypothetical protein
VYPGVGWLLQVASGKRSSGVGCEHIAYITSSNMVAANIGRSATGQKRTLTPHLLTPTQYRFTCATIPLLVGMLLFSCTMLAVMMDTSKEMAFSNSEFGRSVSWFATVRAPIAPGIRLAH